MSDLTERLRVEETVCRIAGGPFHGALPPGLTGEPELRAHRLSAREVEILALIARGKTSKEIALDLGLSVHTVRQFRKGLCRKLALHSAAELVAFAARFGSRCPAIILFQEGGGGGSPV